MGKQKTDKEKRNIMAIQENGVKNIKEVTVFLLINGKDPSFHKRKIN